MKQGVICMSRSFPLLLLFRHAPDRKCENLALQIQKEIAPSGNLVTHPQTTGNAPSRELGEPGCLAQTFFPAGITSALLSLH